MAQSREELIADLEAWYLELGVRPPSYMYRWTYTDLARVHSVAAETIRVRRDKSWGPLNK